MKNDPRNPLTSNHDNGSRLAISDHTAKIRIEQIKLLFQLSKTAFLATPVLAVILVLVHWNQVSRQLLLGWLAVICLLTLTRFFHVSAYLDQDIPDHKLVKAAYVFLFGVFLAGVLWGLAGGIFFVNESPVHKLFLAYLLGGIVAGAMTTLSSYQGAFLIFSVPVMLPFTYKIIMHGGETHLAMALTFLLFLLLMIKISTRNFNTISFCPRRSWVCNGEETARVCDRASGRFLCYRIDRCHSNGC